jgi:hypothetical protein
VSGATGRRGLGGTVDATPGLRRARSAGPSPRGRDADPGLEDRFFEINIDLLCQLDFNGYFKR